MIEIFGTNVSEREKKLMTHVKRIGALWSIGKNKNVLPDQGLSGYFWEYRKWLSVFPAGIHT